MTDVTGMGRSADFERGRMGKTCDATAAGYDGMFGISCDLPAGHDGLHMESGGGAIKWDWATPDEQAAAGLAVGNAR